MSTSPESRLAETLTDEELDGVSGGVRAMSDSADIRSQGLNNPMRPPAAAPAAAPPRPPSIQELLRSKPGMPPKPGHRGP